MPVVSQMRVVRVRDLCQYNMFQRNCHFKCCSKLHQCEIIICETCDNNQLECYECGGNSDVETWFLTKVFHFNISLSVSDDITYRMPKLSTCPLCYEIVKDPIKHVLSTCSWSIDSGRYTWRHNNVLKYIVHKFLMNCRSQVRSDLPDTPNFNGGTMDPSIVVTKLIPDLVLTTQTEIIIFEFSLPHFSNIQIKHEQKERKYKPFETTITSYKTTVLCVEIGSNGWISGENIDRLWSVHNLSKAQISFENFLSDISEIALISSYHIAQQSHNTEWNPPTDDLFNAYYTYQ